MSLWTPGGEHTPSPPTPSATPEPDFDPDDLSDSEREQLQEIAGQMAEVRQQLLSVPASTIVANHVMGLYELAAIHLSNQPPTLSEARVAVDAMGAVVDACEGRLGENEVVLRDALAQLRLAYVQLQAAAGEGTGPSAGS